MTEQLRLFNLETMEPSVDVILPKPVIVPPQIKPNGRKSKLARTILNHKKELIRLIYEVGAGMDRWKVFREFVEMSALAIANAWSVSRLQEREERYLKLIRGYEPKYQALFPQMLAELTEALEQEEGDVLGSVFHELEIADKWKGQFFTPNNISRMIAEMNIGDASELRAEIAEKGFVTVQEPACGAGGMVIEFANALRRRNINFHDHMLAVCVDIDSRAVHMTYVQLSLFGIPAIVVEGNALTREQREVWYTPFFFRHSKFLLWERQQQKGANAA